ncbi:MAG: DoxX family protein [Actinomycetota bacterium]|nr:DoxX family protein [Actinomycetota bacterium]
MNTALWIAAGLLAAAFLVTGILKLTQPKEKIRESLGWVDDFSPRQVKAIGAVEVLGAIGLIVPGITGVAPVLVPIAALGLALVMIGAAVTHIRRGEVPLVIVNLVLFAMASFVAWGRFGSYPL